MLNWLFNPKKIVDDGKPESKPEEAPKILHRKIVADEATQKMKDEVEKPGLRAGFSVGEVLPWKGVGFKIESVTYDTIVLKAFGITKKRSKEIDA